MGRQTLFYRLGGLLLAFHLMLIPVKAETLTFEYTAKSMLIANEEPKEAEMLAALESFHQTLAGFVAHLETLPLVKQSKVKKEYLSALAYGLIDDVITFNPQSLSENGLEVKTKISSDSFKWPENLDNYFQQEYMEIALSKIALVENEKLTNQIKAFVQKTASVRDPNTLQTLRQTEGLLLRQQFNVDHLLNQAYRLNRNNQYDKAIQLLTEAIQANPTSASLYVARADAYEEQKKHDLTLKDLAKALELQPNEDVYYYYRGLIYYEQGILWQEARQDFSKSIELNPNFAEAYFMRGFVHERLGNCFNAISDYRKACELGLSKGCSEQCESD